MTDFCTCCGAETRQSYEFGPWRADGPVTVQPFIFFDGVAQPEVTGTPGRLLATLIRNQGRLRHGAAVSLSAKRWDADGAHNLTSYMSRLRRQVAHISGGSWEIPRPGVYGQGYELRQRSG